MKTTLLLLLAAGFGLANPVAYEILPVERGLLELTVEKTGLLSGKEHLFTCARYQGTLLIDRDALESSAITMTIDSRSISCHDAWLSPKDLHKVQDYALKDMLAADLYPRITFQSNAIKKIATAQYEVRGMLIIRGISRPSIVIVSLRSKSGEPLSIEGTSRVRLTDFDLKPPTAALGTIGTKNEMSFRFFLTATPQGERCPSEHNTSACAVSAEE